MENIETIKSTNSAKRTETDESREPVTVGELPAMVNGLPQLEKISDVEVPEHLKEPVSIDDLEHREFDDTRFWTTIPAFRHLSREEFIDHKFQNRNSVVKVAQLEELLKDRVCPEFLADVKKAVGRAPMNMRLSPYILGLINWDAPYADPIRRQFIPVASELIADHPKLMLDSLNERADSPTPGLVHRYPDKALFLPLDVCPVYCRFCTRSYAIGGNTESVVKAGYKPRVENWDKAFAYLASRPEVEDVVISGGDAYMLPTSKIREIGELLLSIPHIRRIRFASKGPAVMPMKIISDTEWTDALADVVAMGRKMFKEVAFHTHFNSVNEITSITLEAMNALFKRGVEVRNQSVLIRGVNDRPEDMINLIRQLSYMNVQPSYVYQHDMVKGLEDLRTTVATTVEIERHVRGTTAGFNTPTFVNDVPGGGGKRDVHSFDHYNETTGISVYRSPSVDNELVYLYYDPIHLLPEEGQKRWEDKSEHNKMVEEAIEVAGLSGLNQACE